MIHMRNFTDFELRNQKSLVDREIEFSLVQITATGIKKSIMDATDPIRELFKRYGIHDYEKQIQGPKNKVFVDTEILCKDRIIPTKTSLYRPITKKGDPRFWTYSLKKNTSADNIHAIICHQKKIYIINISTTDIDECCDLNSQSPLKAALVVISSSISKVSDELLMKFRDIEGKWIPAEVTADTGIGRTIETLLGIPMNDSKDPDYHGIELKSFRDKRPSVRKNLFCKVPNWDISHLKSAKEIVDKYGYGEPKAYRNTLYCNRQNSQNLRLNLNYITDHLEIEEDLAKSTNNKIQKVNDVAVWVLSELHNALLQKHKETFWIEVESKKENNQEFFKIKKIEHTRNPIMAQFDVLIEQGKITVDLLLGRPRDKKGGDCVSFKIKKDATNLLFPESKLYIFK